MLPAELVIFDCDGVLVDSEVVSNEVLGEVLGELGWVVGLEEAIARFKGRAMTEIWQEAERHLGIQVTREIDSGFRSRQLAALAARVGCVEGVREVLDALPIPFCVASNGPHEKMRITLGATGLLGSFEGRMFSRVDVRRGKPHPDLFLHTAHTLGVRPERCWVVEDSPLGIEAARRAGMRAIGFAGGSTGDAESLAKAGAAPVLLKMSELLGLFR